MGVRTTDAALALTPESGGDGAKKILEATVIDPPADRAEIGLGPAVEQAASAVALASSAVDFAYAAWAQFDKAWAVAGRQMYSGGGPVADESSSPAESAPDPSSISDLRHKDGPTRIVHSPAAQESAAPVWSVREHARALNGISEIRNFFRTNEQPIYFFGPTAFNLLGIDRWVRNFQYIVYYDSWDGAHPRLFAPANRPDIAFESSEQIVNYLLRDPEVRAYLKRRGGTPMVAMVFFDEETEEICRELGYTLILPPDSLRRRLDSKIVTTQMGSEAGARSVPNVIGRAQSWGALQKLALTAGLGTDLVVQTPYGDSGKTTFFIKSKQNWAAHASSIIGQELKVMKRINNKAAAVEACITRHGTIVGPFMTDLTGYPELTPYKGGWCGNDLFPEALTTTQRATAIDYVQRLGGRLAQEGYKGFLEIDVLIDNDTDEVYLGELNPRISGASSMTNVTAGAYADVPLFLFHLLEFMEVDYVVDVEEINQRWLELAAIDVWAQLIMKEPVDSVERILAAPRTGTYQLDEDGKLTFGRVSHDWHQVTDQDEAFYMRVYAPGDFRFKGADLGILITKGRMQNSDGLTERCSRYIDGIRSLYHSEPIPEAPTQIPIAYVK
jgi:biotin carboxylase